MIDLQKFCSTDPGRSYLHQPFSRGEYSYATNGHIMIRVSRRDDVPENPNAPDCDAKVLSKVDFVQVFAPVPTVELPAIELTDCFNCDARGTQHDCPSCTCVCRDCAGAGRTPDDEHHSISMDGTYFAMKYARIIFALPGVEMQPKIGKGMDPVPYRFDGGIGVWMPRSAPCMTNTVVRK